MKTKLILAVSVVAVLCVGLMGCSPNDTSSVSTASGTSSASQVDSSRTVDAAYVAAEPRTFTLVDVRTPGEFAQGHIPGAVNIEYSSSPCEGKTVAADTADRFMAAGLTTDDAIVLYCRTGVRAAAAADALESAGFTNVKVYTGSWTDWTSDPTRPVE